MISWTDTSHHILRIFWRIDFGLQLGSLQTSVGGSEGLQGGKQERIFWRWLEVTAQHSKNFSLSLIDAMRRLYVSGEQLLYQHMQSIGIDHKCSSSTYEKETTDTGFNLNFELKITKTFLL